MLATFLLAMTKSHTHTHTHTHLINCWDLLGSHPEHTDHPGREGMTART
jgi:hypothetical protein